MLCFKYTLTIWLEERIMFLFILPLAFFLAIISIIFNPFDEGFLFNTFVFVSFWVGFYSGAFLGIGLTGWMRRKTLWINIWEGRYGENSFPIKFDKTLSEHDFS